MMNKKDNVAKKYSHSHTKRMTILHNCKVYYTNQRAHKIQKCYCYYNI